MVWIPVEQAGMIPIVMRDRSKEKIAQVKEVKPKYKVCKSCVTFARCKEKSQCSLKNVKYRKKRNG